MPAKLDGLKIAHEIAQSRGGKCLSKKYTYAKNKMAWECSAGHRWKSAFSRVRSSNSWCPKCAPKNRGIKRRLDGISIGRKIAKKCGGILLSTEYVSKDMKLKWQCEFNHVWESSFSSVVRQKTWCPDCAGTKKLDGLKIAKDTASSMGGACLSEEYINAKQVMKFQCSCSHIWNACLINIRSGHWCPKCAIIKTTAHTRLDGITEGQDIAKQRNGRLLSTEYKNSVTKMSWECGDCNHIWKAALSSIKNGGRWCPKCAKIKISKKCNNSYVLKNWFNDKEVVCVGSWEKSVAEYFNINKIKYEWQPKAFTTPFLTKTGKYSTYRPDAYLVDADLWIEVKGFFRDDALIKWEWFHNEYKNSELWNKDKLKQMGLIK